MSELKRVVILLRSIPQYKNLLMRFSNHPHLSNVLGTLSNFVVDYVTQEQLDNLAQEGFDYLTWDYSEIDKDLKDNVPTDLKGGDMGYPLPNQKGSDFFDWGKSKELKEHRWMLKSILASGDVERIIDSKNLDEATDFEIEKILLFSEVKFYVPRKFRFDNSWPQDRVKYPDYILSSIQGIWGRYYPDTRSIDILTAVHRFPLPFLQEAVEKCIWVNKPSAPVMQVSKHAIPVRTELTVIPADRDLGGRELGFKVYEIPTFKFNTKSFTSAGGSIYSLTHWGSVASIINSAALSIIDVAR